MATVNEHLNLLGFKAKNKINGLEGVIINVAFDIHGNVSCLIAPSTPGVQNVFVSAEHLEPMTMVPVVNVAPFDFAGQGPEPVPVKNKRPSAPRLNAKNTPKAKKGRV